MELVKMTTTQKTFSAKFFFRPTDFAADVLAALQAAGAVELHENGKWKRKPVEVSLVSPSILDTITDTTVVSLVQDAVKQYVKATFIDKLLPVGNHDWPTVSAWFEESGRGGGTDDSISDEDAAAAATVFLEYWKAQDKEPVGQLFAELCSKKCAWGIVRKLCTPKGKTISVDIVNKYKDKFAEMSVLFAEHKEVAATFAALSAVLADHAAKRFVVEDAASAW